MAAPKSSFEIARAAALKAARTQIRVKHSLAADAEIARVIPELERKIDAALQEGKPITLDFPYEADPTVRVALDAG